ncbi:MAG: DUF2584 family protein [Cyanobacteria bacterium P01_A01_bin.123]
MGMPCEINSILKLKPTQGYPALLAIGACHQVQKEGYRLFPLDVPICLVDENWLAHADIVIERLAWENQTTTLEFSIARIYATPFSVK